MIEWLLPLLEGGIAISKAVSWSTVTSKVCVLAIWSTADTIEVGTAVTKCRLKAR